MREKIKNTQFSKRIISLDYRVSKGLYALKPNSKLINSAVRLSVVGYGLGPLFLISLAVSRDFKIAFSLFIFIWLFCLLFIEHGVKHVVKRNRPDFSSRKHKSYSFPSTHAAATIMAFILMLNSLDSFSINLYILSISISWVIFVCLSRVIYGFHYILDVISGIILGIILSSLIVIMVNF